MKTEEILQANKLIAQFMGWKYIHKDLVFNSVIHGTSGDSLFSGWVKQDQPYTEGTPLIVVDLFCAFVLGDDYRDSLALLQYSDDWNQLVRVVKFCYEIEISKSGDICNISNISDCLSDLDQEGLFKACFEYLINHL